MLPHINKCVIILTFHEYKLHSRQKILTTYSTICLKFQEKRFFFILLFATIKKKNRKLPPKFVL